MNVMAFSPSDGACQKATRACPCGYRGHPRRACTCSPREADRYLARLSGPLLDRVDLQVETPAVGFAEWGAAPAAAESLMVVSARVALARERQARRWGAGLSNALVGPGALRRGALADAGALSALAAAEKACALSARAMDRVLRVARTIADLAGSETTGLVHLAEALQYRALDRLRSGLMEKA